MVIKQGILQLVDGGKAAIAKGRKLFSKGEKVCIRTEKLA